jgi:hypothetical protein
MIFIDQVYHEGHRFLHEAMFSNFSIMHKTIYTFNCYAMGMRKEEMDKLAKTSLETKKEAKEYKNF